MKYLFMVFLCISCLSDSSKQVSTFLEQTTMELSSTQTIDLGASVNDLNFPPFLWRKIWQTQNHCLWYRTPTGAQSGVLKTIDIKTCDDYTSDSKSELAGIQRLNLSIEKNLKMLIVLNDQEFHFEFPLLNLENIRKDNRLLSRLDQKPELSSSAKLIDGKTLRIYTTSFDGLEKFPKQGSLDLSYQHKSALFCHRFNEDCEEVQSFNCQSCLGGWSEVVSFRCGGYKTTKICGRDRCGEKGEPACPRGEFLMNEDEGLCFEGSRAGFCQDGLVTSCDENQILICL